MPKDKRTMYVSYQSISIGKGIRIKDFSIIESIFFLGFCGGFRTTTKAQRKRRPLLKSL